MNIPAAVLVEMPVTPYSGAKIGYKSKYWPSLNGLEEEPAYSWAAWSQPPEMQSERENILLDVIGAYDLLVLQGLSAQGATTRLGLSKSRDELVQELDAETALRLSIQLAQPTEVSQQHPKLAQ